MTIEDTEIDDVAEVDEALEKEALSMGWQPKDKFPGDPDKWTDAATYVERGKHLLPIISENNRRLKNELLTTTKKLDRITQDHEKSLKILEAHFAKIAKQAVEDTKRTLKEQLREARENGDVDLEVDTLEKIQELKDSSATPEKQETPEQPALSPEFNRWQEENPWFGQDRERTDAILAIAKELRDSGNTLQGRAFFEECTNQLESRQDARPTGRVEANVRSGKTGRGKSFADLPKEAKEACWSDVETLVGPGKLYKTKSDWEKAYANVYFGSDES
jgi:hypothetical protein